MIRKCLVLFAAVICSFCLAGLVNASEESEEEYKTIITSYDDKGAECQYFENGDGTISLTAYRPGEVKIAYIPEEVDGKVVTGLYEFRIPGAKEAIVIPKTIERIENYELTFMPCQEYVVDEGNKNFCTIDGVLFEKGTKTLVIYPKAKERSDWYVIPSSVIELEEYAFVSSKIYSISICENIEVIGECAFLSCYDLNYVYLPEGIRKIEDGVFMSCGSLNNIILPTTLEYIGEGAFSGVLQNYFEIPAKVQYIGEGAFGEATSLLVERDSPAAECAKQYGWDYEYTDANDWLYE